MQEKENMLRKEKSMIKRKIPSITNKFILKKYNRSLYNRYRKYDTKIRKYDSKY